MIHRRTPQLAGGGEIIRWHATLLAQPAGRPQFEQGWTAPDISAVVGHIKGQIPHQLHPMAVGGLAQLLPLPLQLPLHQRLPQQGRRLVLVEAAQGLALALGQGLGPLPPGAAPLQIPQHHEAAVIRQPVALAAAPALKRPLASGGLPRPAAQQPRRQIAALGLGSIWVCRIWICRISICSGIAGIQKTLFHQQLGVEQFGVERRTAGGAVGGAGAVGGSQRQQLPGRHAAAPQQLNPGQGAGAKTTAGAGPRQGGGMQQHSTTAFVSHSVIAHSVVTHSAGSR